MVALLKMPYIARFAEEADEDRRNFERRPAHGEVQGRRIDHTISARQNPRINLSLRDLSAGGLAAVADRPIDEGERVSVVVPRRGLISGWDAVGRVVRCDSTPIGYQVAVEFEMLAAA